MLNNLYYRRKLITMSRSDTQLSSSNIQNLDITLLSKITGMTSFQVEKHIDTNNLEVLLNDINSKELSSSKNHKLQLLFELAEELNDNKK